MPNYSKILIYRLVCKNLEVKECYIGSTTATLKRRFSNHKTHTTSAKSLFAKYDDVYIELLEDFPCETKAQLHRREGELQKENINRVFYMSFC